MDDHVAPGGGGGDHQRARLDLVGNDGVGGAVQVLHAPHPDHVRARATNLRAHAVEEVGQVHDVGLLGRVVDHRGALGPGGGQQHVDGAADSDHIEEYVVAHQMICPGVYHAAPILNGGPQRFKALQMLVNGAGADVAAAGIGHLGPSSPAQQRPQQVIAGPQTAGLPVGNVVFLHVGRVDHHPLAGTVVHLRAQLPQNIHQRPHVLDVRQVFDGAGLVAQKRRRNHCHRRVFATADGDFPHQRIAAGDQHFILAFHNAGPCGPPSPLFAVWRYLRHCIQKVSAFIIHDLLFLGKAARPRPLRSGDSTFPGGNAG